jgi:hypothetical protein
VSKWFAIFAVTWPTILAVGEDTESVEDCDDSVSGVAACAASSVFVADWLSLVGALGRAGLSEEELSGSSVFSLDAGFVDGGDGTLSTR